VKRTDAFVDIRANPLTNFSATPLLDSMIRWSAHSRKIFSEKLRTGQRTLTQEERIVLAVRAFDREVNNDGYHQFFRTSSRKFAFANCEILSTLEP
jgi:Domain of unknown function (DUF4375)